MKKWADLTTAERDALVAAKIIGWSSLRQLNNGSIWGIHPTHGGGSLQPVWGYTTNIGTAWEVVDKLREDEFLLSFHDKWRCCFNYQFWGVSDQVAESICIAALKAIGLEID